MHSVAFWFAVGVTAIVAVLLFKLVGLKVPYHPVNQLAAAI